MKTSTADAIMRTLESPNVSDSNLEAANIVDVIASLAIQARQIANAITPLDAVAGLGPSGGHVESLTESVMDATAGLHEIAGAIRELAGAIESK